MKLFNSTPSPSGVLGWAIGIVFAVLFLVVCSSVSNAVPLFN